MTYDYPAPRRGLFIAASLIVAAIVFWSGQAEAVWFEEARLTFDNAASITSPNNSWCVAADDAGNVHAVWYDSRDGNAEIYYKMFDGSTWSADLRLTVDASTSDYPSVAAYGDRVVHVVWHDSRDGNFEIYHKKFDGTSWSADERLTYASNTSWNPCVAVGPDSSVHVVWHDTRDGYTEIYYKKYDGVSWGPDTRLTVSIQISSNPCVAVDDSGHVHVVWDDMRAGNFDIYYKKHDGTSWGPDTKLTSEPETAQRPCIAAGHDGRLHVVWEDYRDGNYEIYYKEFDGTWEADERLTSYAGVSERPSIVVAYDGDPHVVWHDTRASAYLVFYKERVGGVWSPDRQLSFGPGDSKSPSIAEAADSVLHAVWYDNRDGNSEVYWRRSYREDLPSPEIFYVEPDSGYWGSTVHIDHLAGSNFFYAIDVWLERAGEPDIEAENTVVVSSDSITCDFNLWYVAAGLWDVIVENQDGKSDTLASGFRVIGLPDLEVTSIDPDSGYWGDFVHIDSIMGNGFHDSTAVRLKKDGESDLIPQNLDIFPPNRITCDFDLAESVEGHWDLVLENPDGQKDTLADAFYVIGLEKPVIYSITPAVGGAGESVHISDLSGDNFAPNAEVWLDKYPEPAISAVNVSVESPTKITCDIPIPLGVSGTWDVVVENADGQKDTLGGSFEIIAGLWGPDERLTFTGAGVLTSRPNGRCLAIGPDDNVHIVWYDYRHGDPEIYYKMYDGMSWSADERLTESDGNAEYPCVAVDQGSNVHVVWTDDRDGNWEIYYKTYDGDDWSSDQRLTYAPDESRMPAIAADAAGDLHVVWYDHRTTEWDVYYKKYDGTWSADTLISMSGSEAYSALPAIAVDGALNVHTVWYDSRDGGDEIYYRKFNGTIWEPEVRLSIFAGDSWSPSIATTGNKVYVAWHDSRYGSYEIMSRIYDGSSWGPEERITNANGISGNSCLASDDSGHVHLVWHDNRDGNFEIYYNRHNGTTWTGDLRLTTAGGDSKRPFIGCTSVGRLHVIWYDNRDGDNEIYHKMKDVDPASVQRDDTAGPEPYDIRILPNPFSANALIVFDLPRRAEVRVAIYDIAGRAIREMDLGKTPTGVHQIAWDGLDRYGRPVSTGVYFVRVVSGDVTSTAKVVLLR